jgi:hypothetical protein
MSEESDTSAIDEKKKSSSSKKWDFISNIPDFITEVIKLFIKIIVYFIISGSILYACKLAQSNILPTDSNCVPYTDSKPNIQSIKTNIFPTRDEVPLSMKISFPYNEYNSKNFILDMFREYKNLPNSNFFPNYLISIIEAIIQLNYLAFNKILDMLNGLPEIILVMFGPVILAFISLILLFFEHFYIIYVCITNMSWFFKTNTNQSKTGKPNWEDVTIFSPIKFYLGMYLVIGFLILLFFSLPFITILAGILIIFCVLSCITYKAEMGGKIISALPIIQDTFKYYKTLIMSILTLFVVRSAFSKLGIVPGIFSIITLALIYFGMITIDLFNSINKDQLSPLVSDNQAKKTCVFKEENNENRGFLYNLIFGGQKGGTIVKEIKEIGKKISRK